MGFRWECWTRLLAVVVVVTVRVTGTPLHSPTTNNNNYRALSNHQIWEVSSERTAVKVLLDMEKKGLVDMLTPGHSRTPQTTFRVYPHTLSEVSSELSEAGIPYRVLVRDLRSSMEEQDKARERNVVKSLAVEPCTKGSCPSPLSDSYMSFEQEQDKARERNVVKRLAMEPCTKGSCPSPLSDSYMSFEQMEWYLKQLDTTSPRVNLKSIGKSFEGREIWRVHIKPSTDKGQGESVKKRRSAKSNAVWIEGGIHAREWISPATALHILQLILDDETITENTDVFAVPMANPDGYVYSQTTDRMWRKNRRLNEGSDCVGVDLNRNWDEAFGVGASSDPCSLTYKGTEPFSEPETQALKDEMQRVTDEYNLRLVLSLHSYGQTLLYPFGSDRDPPENTPTMVQVGEMFADAARAYDEKEYVVENSGKDFYFASGATDDWAKAKLKADLSYTLELRGGKTNGFILPPEEIESTAQEVWMGFKQMISFINDNLSS